MNACFFPVPGSPSSILTKAIDKSSVAVEWEPPSRKNGNLTSYKIYWQETGKNDTRKSTEVSSTKTKHIVDQLRTCVLYTFSVAAANNKGEGKSVSENGTMKLEGKIDQMKHMASANYCCR